MKRLKKVNKKMANILLLFPASEAEKFNRVSNYINDLGHRVITSDMLGRLIGTSLANGEKNISERLTSLEENVDLVVLIVTQKSVKNNDPLYSSPILNIVLREDRFITLPIIDETVEQLIEKETLPSDTRVTLNSIFQLPNVSYDRDYIGDVDLNLIGTNIQRIINTLEFTKKEKEVKIQRIEASISDFIDEATKKLETRSEWNRWLGLGWNLVGFILLMLGLWTAFGALSQTIEAPHKELFVYIIVSVKTLVTLSLVGAGSRYAFLLGKAYTHEYLRASDRIHAIEFGKFYLRAYGDKVTDPSEVQNIFKNWNIESTSQFSKINSDSIDPKILEKILEALTKVVGKDK